MPNRRKHTNKSHYISADHIGLDASLPVVTDPSDTMTLQQLVENYSNGETFDEKTPIYMGNYSIDVGALNKFERIELYHRLNAALEIERQAIIDERPEPEPEPVITLPEDDPEPPEDPPQ